MADTRQSAFMPTIKCSVCGGQVEISMMGEHVCASSTVADAPAQPPLPEVLGGAFSSLKFSVFDKFSSKKAAPIVDTAAANVSVGRSDELTPISTSTGSLAISPKTPHTTTGSDFPRDDYFAPAIADSPPPSQTLRPGGYGGFGENEPVSDGQQLSISPQKGSLNLLTRMNTIAHGPFETQRPSTSAGEPTQLSPPSDQEVDSHPRPSTSASNHSANAAALLPKMPRKNGYGGFGPPSRDSSDIEKEANEAQSAGAAAIEPLAAPAPIGLGKRSDTFPTRLTSDEGESEVAPARPPSAPGLRPSRPRRPSGNQDQLHPSDSSWTRRPMIRDTSRAPPPRTSLVRPTTRDGSNAPAINLAAEFGVGNPFHSPSVSQSSSHSGSSISFRSQASSNTSPARSATSSRMGSRRQPSDTSQIESLMKNLESSIPDQPSRAETPVPAAAPPLAEKSQRRPPPANLHLDPNSSRTFGTSPPMRSPLRPPMSPLDPAVQDPALRSRQPSVGERSRGNCKACTQLITGKSISSADGRLTGRYHKACFVCTTCMEPFSSATFYVLDDKPYCEHHYHKLNGSLCGSCNRGIEGQYLEDESRKKYHVACFRCGDCGMVLRDGYFEVNGRTYCERDAGRRLQPPMPQIVLREPSTRAPPRHAPTRSGGYAAPQKPMGLPSNPAAGVSSSLNRPFGLPSGQRLTPGQALGRGGLAGPPRMPRMEKRMTRIGMM
ncbi:paxillin [Microdochium nivale]|nr:paxillin [Microdochium nivale]